MLDSFKGQSQFSLYERLGGEQEARYTADRAELESALDDNEMLLEDIENEIAEAWVRGDNQAFKSMKKTAEEFRQSISMQREELKKLPQPHQADAIIIFDGAELPYSQNRDERPAGNQKVGKNINDIKGFRKLFNPTTLRTWGNNGVDYSEQELIFDNTVAEIRSVAGELQNAKSQRDIDSIREKLDSVLDNVVAFNRKSTSKGYWAVKARIAREVFERHGEVIKARTRVMQNNVGINQPAGNNGNIVEAGNGTAVHATGSDGSSRKAQTNYSEAFSVSAERDDANDYYNSLYEQQLESDKKLHPNEFVQAQESRSENQGGFSYGQNPADAVALMILNQSASSVDTPGGNRDNSRGSDIVDERTAREIENEKPAVRERYEGTPQWMKAPNGKDTNLTVEQWLAARTKAFRREYGNWDYDGKTQLTAADISDAVMVGSEGENIDPKDTHAVDKWVKSKLQGSNVTIDSDGTIVNFYGDGLSAGVSKARDRGEKRDISNRILFSKLGEIIKNSVYYDFEAADVRHPRVIGQDIYQSFMKAGDNFYRVELKLDVRRNTIVSYKGHQAYQIKIEPAVYHAQTDKSVAYARTSSNFTISLTDLMEGVKPKEPEVLLDENGEPIFNDIPDKPEPGGKPKTKQEQHVIRYNRKTNDFAKGNPKTGVRSLYKPEKGEAYYYNALQGDVERGGSK